MKIKIDTRFIDSKYELWAVGQYLDAVKEYLPFIKEQERVRTESWLKRKKNVLDESDIDITRQELQDIIDSIFPRFFRYPFVISLWAVYESSIIEVANYMQKKNKLTLKIQDIQGRNFLDYAKKYFDHVLNFPVCTDDHIWERIGMLHTIRNAIAHGNGRIDFIKNTKTINKITNWANKDIGISINNGKLLFSEDFLNETHTIISDSLKDLFLRVSDTFQQPLFEILED